MNQDKASATEQSRYIVEPRSVSSHCCFEATVLDTHRPEYQDKKRTIPLVIDGKPCYETVCESFTLEDAERIAAALNGLLSAERDAEITDQEIRGIARSEYVRCDKDGNLMHRMTEDVCVATVREVIRRFFSARTTANWIPVGERLPQSSLQGVIALHREGPWHTYWLAYYFKDRQEWQCVHKAYPKKLDVTHWMPLPEYPADVQAATDKLIASDSRKP